MQLRTMRRHVASLFEGSSLLCISLCRYSSRISASLGIGEPLPKLEEAELRLRSKYQPEEIEAMKKRPIEGIEGVVRSFSASNGYGFIYRFDTREEIFVFRSNIEKPNPSHNAPSLTVGERVVFNVVPSFRGRVKEEAVRVTGPGGGAVIGCHSVVDPHDNQTSRPKSIVEQKKERELTRTAVKVDKNPRLLADLEYRARKEATRPSYYSSSRNVVFRDDEPYRYHRRIGEVYWKGRLKDVSHQANVKHPLAVKGFMAFEPRQIFRGRVRKSMYLMKKKPGH